MGAIVGLLFAPTPGRDLRNRLSRRAIEFTDAASEGYRQAATAVGAVSTRGRELYETASEAVAGTTGEATRSLRAIERT